MKSSASRHFRKPEVGVRIAPEALGVPSDSLDGLSRSGSQKVGIRHDHVPTESVRELLKKAVLVALVRRWVERFRAKVARSPVLGCDLWRGAIQTKGYGSFGAGGDSKTILAHRFAWELDRGPIPDGMTIDHVVCGRHDCVNTWHMEVVSVAENSRRAAFLRLQHAAAKAGLEVAP